MLQFIEYWHILTFWFVSAFPFTLFLGSVAPYWLNADPDHIFTISVISSHIAVTYLVYVMGSYIMWLLSDDDAKFWSKVVLNRLSAWRNWRTFYQNILQRTIHNQQMFIILGNKSSGKSSFMSHSGATKCGESLNLHKTINAQQWWKKDSHYYLECGCITQSNISNNTFGRSQLRAYFSHLFYGLSWRYQYPCFDGVMLTVSANTLLSVSNDGSPYITNLRNQLEVFNSLSTRTPIYIIITHLDKLPGFEGFFHFLDLDDYDRILGFHLKQYRRDLLTRKLADFTVEIENYLLYALEKKPAYSATTDVTKLHQFLDAIYTVQSKLVKFITSLPPAVPISGCFYSSNADDVPVDEVAPSLIAQPSQHVSSVYYPFFSKNIMNSINKSSTFSPSRSFLSTLVFVGVVLSFVHYPSYILSLFDNSFHDQNYTDTLNKLDNTLVHQFYYNHRILLKNITEKQRNTPMSMSFSIPDLDVSVSTLSTKKRTQENLLRKVKRKIANDVASFTSHPAQCIHTFISLLSLSKQLDSSKLLSVEQLVLPVDFSADEVELIKSEPMVIADALVDDKQTLVKTISPLSDHEFLDALIAAHSLPISDLTHNDYESVQSNAQDVCQLREALSTQIPWKQFYNVHTCKKIITNKWLSRRISDTTKALESVSFQIATITNFEEFIDKLRYTKNHKTSIYSLISELINSAKLLSTHLPKKHQDAVRLEKALSKLHAFNTASTDVLLDKLISIATDIQRSSQPSHAALQWLIQHKDINNIYVELYGSTNIDKLSKSYVYTFWNIIRNMAANELNQQWSASVFQSYNASMSSQYPFAIASSTEVPLSKFQKMFAPQGVIDNFIADYLQPFMERTEQGLTWRKIAGDNFIVNESLLSFIMSHSVLSAMYFPDKKPIISFEASMHLRHSAKGIRAIILQQGDDRQTMDPEHPKPFSIQWPNPAKEVKLLALLDNKETITIASSHGSWSLLKLLQNSFVQKYAKDSFSTRFSWNDKTVEFEVNSLRSIHPFSSDIATYYKPPASIISKN